MADKNHLHRATTTRVVYVANFFLFLFCQKSFKNSTSIALDTLNKMIKESYSRVNDSKQQLNSFIIYDLDSIARVNERKKEEKKVKLTKM